MYFNEIHNAFLPEGTSNETAQKLADFLYSLRPENHFATYENRISQEKQISSIINAKIYKKLRGNALCKIKL
jgi:hypothetical protein